MTERLLDYDPNTGIKQWYRYDETEDRDIIRTEQDVAPIIERNRQLQNETAGTKMGDGTLVASIPVNVQFEWLHKYGVKLWDRDHLPAVKKLLNSSDYRYLKCRDIIL